MVDHTNLHITSNKWELDNLLISHNITYYKEYKNQTFKNDSELVRLHFGLRGTYNFNCKQLNTSFDFTGHHNNIMYTKGLEIEVFNKSFEIETLGINISPSFFIGIAQNGNDILKRFADKVLNEKNSIISNQWKPNTFKIQQVVNEILQSNYTNELQNLFLLSKSIELLVLQADLHGSNSNFRFIKSKADKQKLFEAKEILTQQLEFPPTILQLSKLVNLNEYKLKRGFKELFGTTIFGYIHYNRMNLAKKLLLDTNKSIKEIAYEIGYSSPQHFSNAFKKEFNKTPKSIRIHPDFTI